MAAVLGRQEGSAVCDCVAVKPCYWFQAKPQSDIRMLDVSLRSAQPTHTFKILVQLVSHGVLVIRILVWRLADMRCFIGISKRYDI